MREVGFDPMRRRISVVAVVAMSTFITAVGSAGAATALTPQREAYHDHFRYEDNSVCGFPILFDYSRSVRSTVFFDRDDEPILVRFHITITGTDTANGVTLQDDAVHNSVDDLRTSSEMRVGIEFLVKDPGGGVISVGGGKVVVDENGDVTFEAGPHPFLDGDLDAYCAAFG
jgi:hypothetical protein